MNIRSVTLAGIATLMLALPAAAAVDTSGISGTAPAKAVRAQFAAVVCMTDEGNGRMRPCNALYKQQHPNWRAGDECMTDDGHGRKRPCDALYKQKHDKAKK